MERGAFVPTADIRKQYANALGVRPDVIEDIILEAKIVELGIREPGFVSMFKDYRRLSRRDRLAIIPGNQETQGWSGSSMKRAHCQPGSVPSTLSRSRRSSGWQCSTFWTPSN